MLGRINIRSMKDFQGYISHRDTWAASNHSNEAAFYPSPYLCTVTLSLTK